MSTTHADLVIAYMMETLHRDVPEIDFGLEEDQLAKVIILMKYDENEIT